MPISDFRKKKLLYVFNVFFDVNQSGTIDRKDFELAIEKICTLRGWPQGSDQYKKTYDSMIQIWDGLRQKADSNHDGQVSVEEWASMWDEYSKDPEKALDWQNHYQRFMFDLEDASADGSIDIEEFTAVCSCYGLEVQECRDAFQKMSGSEKICRQHPDLVNEWETFVALVLRSHIILHEEEVVPGGRKEVNYEQFQNLWKQFFISENPSEPGNFIFGKSKF